MRNNINVGIHYLGSWLAGNGCVPIHNLMEDAATAEMVKAMIPEELAKVKATVTANGEKTETYDQAAGIFEKMALAEDYPELLTLPLYEAMA